MNKYKLSDAIKIKIAETLMNKGFQKVLFLYPTHNYFTFIISLLYNKGFFL